MSFMNGYDQPNIYIFNFWSLDEISNWNDEVSRNCDSAGGLATQSPDTPFRQSQDLIASEESPVILKETLGPGVSFQPGPKHSASHTQEQTEPFFFRKSPLTTREHVSEAFLFSPRLNTPSLTDVSTVVPGYPSSVSDGSAEGPCPPTPPLILFNASAGYGNQLSTTESSTSLPLSSLTSAAKVEDRYICLFPGCELTFRRVADLKRHGLKHISLAFPCPILGCGFRSFTRRDKLLDHARRVHPEAHLSKFEAVNLNSTFHTTKTLAASGDHQSVHDTETDTCRSPCRELKKEMTRPGSDFSPDSLDTFTPVFDAHIQSQLAEVTHTHSNPSQASTNIQTASDSTAQAVGADLAVSSEKIVDHDKQKSISLSLWPAQYLALLDLGSKFHG